MPRRSASGGCGTEVGPCDVVSAVLVDEEGKIASEGAVGAPAVLELAGAPSATG
jgi:hypothetical protein